MTTRRRLLAALAGGSVGSVAGCGCDEVRDGPTAHLEPGRETRVGPVEGDWVIDGTVVASFLLYGDDPTRGFHDVRATARAEDGEVLGRTRVGDFELGDADESTPCGWDVLRRPFRLRVGGFPHRLLLSAEEKDRQCEPDPTYDVVVRDANFNDDHYDVGHSGPLWRYWAVGSLPCSDEGTPE